jgi:glutathione S-transferase
VRRASAAARRGTEELLAVAGEARSIEGRLATSDWVVGLAPSAADLAVCPWIERLEQALLRPAGRRAARAVSAR